MKRMNVQLDSVRYRAVVKEAKKLGVSASEVIRGLIDEGLLQRDYDDKRWRMAASPIAEVQSQVFSPSMSAEFPEEE